MKTKRILLILLSCAWVLALALASGCHDKQCDVSVEGTVTDSLTGKPIPGIILYLYAEHGINLYGPRPADKVGESETDIDGKYLIKGTIDCSYHLIIFHGGNVIYASSSDITLKNGSNHFDFKLKRN